MSFKAVKPIRFGFSSMMTFRFVADFCFGGFGTVQDTFGCRNGQAGHEGGEHLSIGESN